MKLLDWLVANRPGNVSEHDDRYEIEHESGEHSTLFKNVGSPISNKSPLKTLGDIYCTFDGADLFSSTFKVASLVSPRSVEGVELVRSLHNFKDWLDKLDPNFSESVIPFMYQAGIGFYAIGEESGKIYEWDEEQGALSDEFDTLDKILKEWIDAIS